jgi:hypothetical protein
MVDEFRCLRSDHSEMEMTGGRIWSKGVNCGGGTMGTRIAFGASQNGTDAPSPSRRFKAGGGEADG